jgi:vanillate O-demethylase monooxygenase subunit
MQGRALMDLNPALLPMDAAAIRARRILEKKIAGESAQMRGDA